ncbi:MAG: L,D-transpeptidase [Cellulosilyticaceae bacterium]
MKRLFLILLFSLCLSVSIFATPTASTPFLGELSLSSKTLSINQVSLPLYQAFSQDYIPLFILGDIGYDVGFNASSQTVVVSKPTKALPYKFIDTSPYWDTLSFTDVPFELYSGSIYIEGFQTHGIIANGRVLVPIEALKSLGTLHTFDTDYLLTYAPDTSVVAHQFAITNYAPSPTSITVNDVFWNGTWMTRTSYHTLAPYESIRRDLSQSTGHYVSSIVTSTDNPSKTSAPDFKGQLNTSLFTLSDRAAAIGDLSQYGDPLSLSDIIDAENRIREMNFTSDTPYLIWTDMPTQRTYIFENKDGEWHLLKHFLCSTGKASSPTPRGEYKLTKKVPYFGLEKGYRCKNAFGFIGTTYLYHSVMFDVTGTYMLHGKGSLGKPASAGCIRLSPENSLWLYEHMLSGTKVYIQ